MLNILGVAGVTASLIFVGLELRQSQRIALVSQIQERSYAASAETNAFTEADISYVTEVWHSITYFVGARHTGFCEV